MGLFSRAPVELYVTFLASAMHSFAYFAVASIFTIYLSNEHAYSDLSASLSYGLWGFSTSLWGWITSVYIDKAGLRKSLAVGSLMCSVGMAMFGSAYGSHRTAVLRLAAYVVMPLGLSLGAPVFTICVNRYVARVDRSLAYGILYAASNIGAVCAGLTLDGVRGRFEGQRLFFRAYSVSSERVVVLFAAVVVLLVAGLTSCTLRDIVVDSEGQIQTVDSAQIRRNKRNLSVTRHQRVQRHVTHPWHWRLRHTAKRMWSDKMLWRIMLFTAIMIGSRQMFRHLDATMPKWLLRVLGKDAPIGRLYAINPALIVVLSPIAGALLADKNIYTIFIVGTFVSSVSIAFLCAFVPSISSVAAFFVVFTVGEAIYSPQIASFIMMLAPYGSEGVYSQVAAAPTFVSKLLVGLMSGELLQVFCPSEANSDKCVYVMVVIGGVALLTPLLLLAFKSYLFSEEVQFWVRQPVHSLFVHESRELGSEDDTDDGLLSSTASISVEMRELHMRFDQVMADDDEEMADIIGSIAHSEDGSKFD